MKKAALLLSLLLPFASGVAAAFELPVPSTKPYVWLEADKGEYNRVEDKMHLTGHVRIEEKGRPDGLPAREIFGEDFTMYPSSSVAVSSGAVLVKEGADAFYGEDGSFNWELKTGTMSHVSAQYSQWRVLDGEELSLMRDGEQKYRKVSITSCNEKEEHYKISLGSLSVIPKRRIFGTNAVLYLDRVPVMYMPIFYKPLGTENKYVTYVAVGYDERSGASAKTTTVYNFNPRTRGKLFLDYFTKLGVGLGSEFGYNDPKKFNGSVAGYYIKENGTDNKRWGLTGGYWWNLSEMFDTRKDKGGALYYSQSQFRLVSDPYFNNDFFRSNPYAVSPDANASFAVVRQTAKTSTRVSYSKKEVMDGTTFIKTYEARPRLDFNTAPFGVLGLPVLNTVTAFYESAMTNTTGYYLSQADFKWNMDKSFYVGGISIVPTLFYDQSVQMNPYNSDYSARLENQWVGRVGGALAVRRDIFWGGTADFRQTFVRRLSTNSFSRDLGAEDYGTETNMFSYSNFFRPNQKTYFIFSTGYDLRDFRNKQMAFSDRVQPLVAQFAYTPKPELNVFFNDTYALGDGNRAFVVQADFGKLEGNRMGIGFSNYKSTPTAYILNHTFNYFPEGASWGIKAGIGYKFTFSGLDFKNLQLFSKELTLIKDFHDFHTEWLVRFRPGVQSFSFNVGLRFNTTKERVVSDREAQRFWYPWREQGENPNPRPEVNPAVQSNPF
ncbi:MAG: hypothetical protein WCS77_05770 [Elusimicrobiaceae bacterium]